MNDCWGCGAEPDIDGTLGTRCRRQLAELRTDQNTPRVNDLVTRLGDGYHRLCWNCRAGITTAISGLCPPCEDELRR